MQIIKVYLQNYKGVPVNGGKSVMFTDTQQIQDLYTQHIYWPVEQCNLLVEAQGNILLRSEVDPEGSEGVSSPGQILHLLFSDN